MRRLIVAVAVLGVLAVAADRAAAWLAGSAVAARITSAQQLAQRPQVRFEGVPFLTQAIGGRYDDVRLTLRDLRRGPVPVARLTADLHGVHVPLSAVLHRRVTDVAVDDVSGEVLLTYADVNDAIRAQGITVAPAGNRLRVIGTVEVLGFRTSASAEVRLAVSGDTVTATAVDIAGLGALGQAATALAGGRLSWTVRVGALPFGLRLRTVSVTPAGLVLTGEAAGVRLSTGGSGRG